MTKPLNYRGPNDLRWKSRDWIADITRLRTSGEARSMLDACFQLDLPVQTLRPWIRSKPGVREACTGFKLRSKTTDVIAFTGKTIERYRVLLAEQLALGTDDLRAKWNAADQALIELRAARAEQRRQRPQRPRPSKGKTFYREKWPKIVARRQLMHLRKWSFLEALCNVFNATVAEVIEDGLRRDAMVYYFVARNELARLLVRQRNGEKVGHLIERYFRDWHMPNNELVEVTPLDLAKVPGHEAEVEEIAKLRGNGRPKPKGAPTTVATVQIEPELSVRVAVYG